MNTAEQIARMKEQPREELLLAAIIESQARLADLIADLTMVLKVAAEPGGPKPTEDAKQQVFTGEEAQAFLKLSRLELYRQRKAGRLGYCKVGTKVLYLRRHLEEFLKEHEHVSKKGQR